MPRYIIAHFDVTHPAGFERYRAVVPKVVEQYGGHYLVRRCTVDRLARRPAPGSLAEAAG